MEDDVLSKYPIVDSLGRTQQATFVNEDGLYDTILESRKPGAKAFRKWVTSEVLPSIRKQGGYMVARADEPDEVIMARALQIMHATLMRRDKELALLRPKAEYVDKMLDGRTPPQPSPLWEGVVTTGMSHSILTVPLRQVGRGA